MINALQQATVIRRLRDTGGVDIQSCDGRWYEIRVREIKPDDFKKEVEDFMQEVRDDATAE